MKKYGSLLVILGSALWGTDALFRRPLTGVLSPITIVLLEHSVLCLAVLPIVAKCRLEFRNLQAGDYAALAFIAFGGSAAATSLFTFSVKYGNPTVVILLQKTQPLFTVILARLFLGERPAGQFWRWFAAAIAGALLISMPDGRGSLSIAALHPAVVFSAVGAAGLWGGSTVCGRFLASKLSIPFLTALRFIFAWPLLLGLYFLQPASQRLLPTASLQIISIVEMALIPGLAGLLIYYRGLKSVSASLASVCELSFPVTAVVVNWAILGARLTAPQLLGSVILLQAVTILAYHSARGPSMPAGSGSKLIRS